LRGWLSLPKPIELMKKREEELLKLIQKLSQKTRLFSNPEAVVIGGYALRAFIQFSRYTRDCDFALPKSEGWNIDKIKNIMPKDFSVEAFEKYETYGFMRCIKFVEHNKLKIKISVDFMEGEIRGREANEIIRIDENMMKNRKLADIPIANKIVKLPVPSYVDYFIMKVISARPSDIRDVASLVLENGIPKDVEKRAKELLPHPKILQAKLDNKILPELMKKTFLNSWRGTFATTRYAEEDKQKVITELKSLL